MAEPSGDEDRVSKEAHQRIVTERDQLKAKLAELEPVVADLGKEKLIRSALKGKVSDPDYVAEMMLPHLRDIEGDKLTEQLESDRFKPLVTAFAATSGGSSEGEGADDGEGKGGSEPPADPGTGFAGPGPNPGAGNGQPVDPNQKLAHNSPEIRAAIERGDHAWVEEQYKAGRVAEPVRKY